MDKNRLTRLLDHPETIDYQDIIDLEKLVQEYPYFTAAQMLLAVGMIRIDHEKAQQQLQKAAAMAPNRNVLRKLCTQLPDEYVASAEIIPEKTILIPEIDLGGTSEDLNREVALLEEKKKTLDELMAIIENKISELENAKKQPKKEEKKLSKAEIIDKFIAENPSISRPKQEFFNPISAAQESIIDQENIVSETLATIYENQGYFEKAISIYEKLKLKYPDLTQCYSTRGLNAVAGVNIANTINNLFKVVFLSLGTSVGIIVGGLLGAGKLEEAREADRKIILFSVIVSCFVGLVMLSVSGLFPMLFNTNEIARTIAASLIAVQAICLPIDAFKNATYFTLRSGGRTFITFLFDGFSIMALNYPVAYILSRFTDVNVVWIFVSVQIAGLAKGLLGYVLVKRGVWVRNIVTE